MPFTPAQDPTPQQVADYLTGLPANSPNAPERHTTPIGQGVSPTPADTITTNPVTPSQIAPTVKPAAQVIPTDTVVKFKQEHLDRWIDQHTVKARPAAQERVQGSL